MGADSQAKFDDLLTAVVRADWSANIFDDADCECFKMAPASLVIHIIFQKRHWREKSFQKKAILLI